MGGISSKITTARKPVPSALHFAMLSVVQIRSPSSHGRLRCERKHHRIAAIGSPSAVRTQPCRQPPGPGWSAAI